MFHTKLCTPQASERLRTLCLRLRDRHPFRSEISGSFAAFRVAIFSLVYLSALACLTERGMTASPQEGPRCFASDVGGVPAKRLQLLARGFSLPGWTDQWPPREPNETMLANLRRMGLSHVRLPLRLEMISVAFSEKGKVERSFGQIDRALDTLLRLGYSVSLDMHPAEQFQDLHEKHPDQAVNILKSVWHVVASRYAKHSPDRVFYEVLNEPVVSAAIWAKQGRDVVDTIRRVAPHHTIIYGPTFFQRVEALNDLAPLDQTNIVYAIHFYDPMAFTHQGQNWGPDQKHNEQAIPFPAGSNEIGPVIQAARDQGNAKRADELTKQFEKPWTRERISGIFLQVGNWAARTGRPVIANEFGVLSFRAAPQARAEWVRAVRSAAEAVCIGWTHWEYADGFGFVHRRGRSEILDPHVGPAIIDP